jgi:PAS domain S-box-containing protein
MQSANLWNSDIGLIQPRVVEMLVSAIHILYLITGIHTNATGILDEYLRLTNVAVASAETFDHLLDGNSDSPSVLGVDPDVDALLVRETCDLPHDELTDFHAKYRCQPLTYTFPLFIDVTKMLTELLANHQLHVNDSDLAMNLFHVASKHIYPSLTFMNDFFSNRPQEIMSAFDRDSAIILAARIVLMIIYSFLVVMGGLTIGEIYDGAMTFLKRCSPAGIVANRPLVRYLLDQSEADEVKMTPSQALIHASHDGVICFGLNGVIESVSESITRILGHIPEQILGQQVFVLLTPDAGTTLEQRLGMMSKRECPKVFSDQIECLNDHDAVITCGMTLMIMEDQDGEFTAFVAILQDITSLLEQRQAAEHAKASSEKLLYEILPRDIVNRLNQHETDISFVVQSATLMFIDIQKFSAYTATLTPQEIMGNLSLIFGGFDALLPTYPLITKIKLIGDVYMCGSGLFSPNESPEKHAEQTVRFALDAHRVINDANTGCMGDAIALADLACLWEIQCDHAVP